MTINDIINKRKEDMLLDATDITITRYYKIVMKRRLSILKKVREGLDDDGYVFLFPYKGTGDVYIAASYLQNYVEQKNIKNYVLCVNGTSNKKICNLFGFDNIKVISQTDVDNLLYLGMFVGFDTARIVVLHADPPQLESGISDRMRNYNGYDFLDMFSNGVFESKIVPSLPSFNNCEEEAKEFFEKNSLVPGKTIVISPYVNTLDRLPEWFWIQLVARLKWMGYTACTNCVGKELPTFGSVALDLPYEKMKSYIEYAGFFISSRNGLCDIISSFNCKKIIIYNPYLFWGCGKNIDYFSLKKMGLSDEVTELEYVGIEFLALMNEIIEAVNYQKSD